MENKLTVKEHIELIHRFAGITENSIMPNFDRIPKETWETLYEDERINIDDFDANRYFAERNILKAYISHLENILISVEEELRKDNPCAIRTKVFETKPMIIYFKSAIEALLDRNIN